MTSQQTSSTTAADGAAAGPRATTPAVDVALAYHRAWTSGDLDEAMRWVDADVAFDTPAGPLTGAAALRGYMEPFARSLVTSHLIAAQGSGDEALVIYDTASRAVASAPAAEWYRVVQGRITAGRIVFDRLPFALARGDVVAT